MPKLVKREYRSVAARLQSYLTKHLGEVTVQIGDDLHYPGTNIVVTCPRFAGLLPEQRFYLILRAMPPEFYDEKLRGAGVWFELAPGESGKDLMKMPRSEDIVGRAEQIRDRLRKIGLAARMRKLSETSASTVSGDAFSTVRQLLRTAGWNDEQITEACLLFIADGAFSDAQIITELLPQWVE